MYRRLLLSLFATCAVIPIVSCATYDYIVVGSGPGGGPLAANLAKAGYSTLLIDAGGDEGSNPTYTNIANRFKAANDVATRWDFWVKHYDDPELDAAFHHLTWDTGNGTYYIGNDPPPGAKYLGIQYPRAAVLGGCAMHNAGISLLPQDDDWNVVVERTGDRSWEAGKMRKYFKQIEKNEYLPAGDPAHGYNGWLSTSLRDTSWAAAGDTPAVRMLQRFAELIGQNSSDPATLMDNDILGDLPNKDQISDVYGMAIHATKSGQRTSPNNYVRATLDDAANYPLTLKLHTLVTKVLFSESTKKLPRAIGVEVMEGASLYKADPRNVLGTKGPVSRIYANKEVIISGGTFNSPQILKLSGIGPKAELKKFGIKVVKHLPGVGENLGDNYESSLLGLSAEPIVAGSATGIFRTANAATKKRNIFAWCGPFSFEGFWPGFPANYGPNQWECAIVHIGPKTQAGSVTLRTADPQDTPEINLRFFSKQGKADLNELVSATNLLRQTWLAAGPGGAPFQELHPCPGEPGKVKCTTADQTEFIKNQAWSHHATSTCAIGADNDPMAVLDSKFRVRGVLGLRVVDASAFPRVPGAFPVVPTMMLSQKATEDILADAKKA